jgi:hypothetical protein
VPKLSSVTVLTLFTAPPLAEYTHVDPTLLPCPHKSMSGERQKTNARNSGDGNGNRIAHENCSRPGVGGALQIRLLAQQPWNATIGDS